MGLRASGARVLGDRAQTIEARKERVRHRLEGTAQAVRALQEARRTWHSPNKVVVAVARELSGFVWAIARELKPLS